MKCKHTILANSHVFLYITTNYLNRSFCTGLWFLKEIKALNNCPQNCLFQISHLSSIQQGPWCRKLGSTRRLWNFICLLATCWYHSHLCFRGLFGIPTGNINKDGKKQCWSFLQTEAPALHRPLSVNKDSVDIQSGYFSIKMGGEVKKNETVHGT